MRFIFLPLILALFGVGPAQAQAPSMAPPPPATHLKVGVYIAPPFVMPAGDGYTGYTWELWRQIAIGLNFDYDIAVAPTMGDLLQMVRDKKADVGVSNISITAERYQTLDFSQPYFDAGLRIMIDETRRTTLRKIIADLHDGGFLRIYAWIGVLIVVATIVLTLIDRRWHPEFPEKWGEGMAESFRHVMSVVTTGNTSHRNLLGAFGTVLGGLWLACGVAVVAYVTSSVTSVMTASTIAHQINGPSDLAGKHVGVLSGSTGEDYARAAMLDTQSFDQMQDAVDALLTGQITAIIRDAPVLEYFDKSHPELPVTVVGPVFRAEKYGLALPQGSPLARPISEEILRLADRGVLDSLRAKYFGNTR